MHQDKFKDINNAYQVLSDEKKKKKYDEMREAPKGPKGNEGAAGQDYYNQNKTYNTHADKEKSKYY